jgi:uncharacterized protein with HEPN domain
MAHDPLSAVLDMVQALDERLASGMDEGLFLADERTQRAVYSQIVIAGEAAGRVDRTFQAAHLNVPWSGVIGMRHRLVHGYGSVD